MFKNHPKPQLRPMPKGVATEVDNSRTPLTAYTQGSRGFLKGRTRDSNPHDDEELQTAWYRGFDDTAQAHKD